MTFAYDGDQRRVKRVAGGTTRYFVRDAEGNVLAEYDGSNSLLIEHIYLEGKRIASVYPTGKRFYIQHDLLGSSWIVTSDAGVATSSYNGYFPFGWVEPFDFGGEGLADESDLLAALCTLPNPVSCDSFESGNTNAWTCQLPGSCVEDPTAERYTGKDLDAVPEG